MEKYMKAKLSKLMTVIFSAALCLSMLCVNASAAGIDKYADKREYEVALTCYALRQSVKTGKFTVKKDSHLIVPKGVTLTVPEGKVITIKGMLTVENGGCVNIKGNCIIEGTGAFFSGGRIIFGKSAKLEMNGGIFYTAKSGSLKLYGSIVTNSETGCFACLGDLTCGSISPAAEVKAAAVVTYSDPLSGKVSGCDILTEKSEIESCIPDISSVYDGGALHGAVPELIVLLFDNGSVLKMSIFRDYYYIFSSDGRGVFYI